MNDSLKKTIVFCLSFNMILIGALCIFLNVATVFLDTFRLSSDQILRFAVLELFLAVMLYSYFKDRSLIRDEREQAIELKAYKATYTALIYVILAFMMLNLFKDGKTAITVEPSSAVLFFAVLHRFSVWHYRKKI